MIEVHHEVEAVARLVGTRTLETGEARTSMISRSYDVSLEDLWEACTNSARIPQWFLPISGELRLGGRYQLEGHAGGTIERCDPPQGFAATWEYGEDVSWIEVRLEAESDGRARFELEHVAHISAERWAEFGPGAAGVGWDLLLVSLGLHLRSGEAVDPAAFAAWSGSGEGRTFIERSSQAWCDASIAAGDDAAEATAAAARTTAAYTGAPGDQ